jgi:hypothetical protein
VGAVARKDLVGRWTHSYEDDTADTQVYRPASYSFPRSRGRASFELKDDGTLIDHPIGQADVVQSRGGRWRYTADGRLVLEVTGGPSRVLQILSADADRMVVKK